MSSPAARHGREVRARLLQAAVELIAERGWTAVSTRVLAARAGVTPSVVHYHFPSVPALLREAVSGALQQALGDIDTMLASVQKPADVVDRMLAWVDDAANAGPLSRVLVEAYLAATRDDQLRADITSVLAESRKHFARGLAEAGVPDADDTAAVLVATFDGLILHRGLGAGPASGNAGPVLYRLVGAQAPTSVTETSR